MVHLGMTKREAQVVDALFKYGSTYTAAAFLDVSVLTIRQHMKSVRKKANVKSNLELVALVFKQGGFLY